MVKVIFTAPSAEGLNGNLEHRSWTYLENTPDMDNKINSLLIDFVMETGVNRDMVTITKEEDEES